MLALTTRDGEPLRVVQVTPGADPDGVPFRYAPGQRDGPLTAAGWAAKCRGRVVGVMEAR